MEPTRTAGKIAGGDDTGVELEVYAGDMGAVVVLDVGVEVAG